LVEAQGELSIKCEIGDDEHALTSA